MSKLRKYVLTLKDQRSPEPADEAQVERSDAKILERVGRSVKVEAPNGPVEVLREQLPSWHVEPEISYDVPDTRRFVQQPPEKPKP